jgi:hypothetical protein
VLGKVIEERERDKYLRVEKRLSNSTDEREELTVVMLGGWHRIKRKESKEYLRKLGVVSISVAYRVKVKTKDVKILLISGGLNSKLFDI